MINIPVDEARAFDELIIHTLKLMHGKYTDVTLYAAANALNAAIARGVGVNLFNTVYGSAEYENLFRLNSQVFDAINRLKTDGEWPGAALEIDGLNYQRYLAKQALQKRFFPETPLTERKMGYGEGEK